MALTGPFGRARARRRDAGSGEVGPAIRELRRAIERAGRGQGEPAAAQIAGQPLMPDDYARWRRQKLGQGAIFTAPELDGGQYAFVLLAIDLESDEEFAHHGAGGLLTQPTVEPFPLEVEPALALTMTLSKWLEAYPGPVRLAPPLLQFRRRWLVADLGLEWELKPNEL